MAFPAILTLLYAIAMGGGGWAGWRFAGSLPSLVGGAFVGGLAFLGAILMLLGVATGRGVALFGAALAVLFFAWRVSQGLLQRRPVGRAGGILLLSALEIAVLVGFRAAGP